MPWYAIKSESAAADRIRLRQEAREAVAQVHAQRAKPGFRMLTRPFHLRVFGEYSAESVWTWAPGFWAGQAAAALPISASLAARCLLWSYSYDRHENAWLLHVDLENGPEPPFDFFEQLNLRGFWLACALKRALPDCRVEFIDEFCNLPWRNYSPGDEEDLDACLIEIDAETMRHERASRLTIRQQSIQPERQRPK